MRNAVRAIGLHLVVLVLFGALHLAAPRPVLACTCCACDFGGDDIECGDGDIDCGVCIVLGGTPAPSCDECSGGDCDGQTLCSADPQDCAADVDGACCVPSIPDLTPGGCFIMTAAACASLDGTYRGDNTDCSAPCVSVAQAPAMSTAGIAFAGTILLAVGALGIMRRRARRRALHAESAL